MAASGHSSDRWDLSFWLMFSLVKAHGLRCSEAGEILVPPPGVEPRSPVLQGRFLPSGPLVKSWGGGVRFYYFVRRRHPPLPASILQEHAVQWKQPWRTGESNLSYPSWVTLGSPLFLYGLILLFSGWTRGRFGVPKKVKAHFPSPPLFFLTQGTPHRTNMTSLCPTSKQAWVPISILPSCGQCLLRRVGQSGSPR